VFGWMEVPFMVNGVLDYRGTYDWDTHKGGFLHTPSFLYFCSQTVNNCNYNNIPQSDPCPAENSSCWWDAPVQWVSDGCATSCVTDTPWNAPNNHIYYDTPGLPEPVDPPLSATCVPGPNTPVTNSTGSLLPGTVLVDDEMIPSQNPGRRTPNLMGCPASNPTLVPPASAHASFSLLGPNDVAIDAAASPGQLSAVDLHQLGGGIGGQMFFTHTGGDLTTEARGRWQATLPANTATGTAYQVYAFVPDIGASTGHATYEINPGGGYASAGEENNTTTDPAGDYILARTINQGNYTNQWVSLGYYLCGGSAGATGTGPSSCTMTVTARSATPSSDSTQGSDIAFNAVAFVPAPTGGYVALGDSYSSGEGVFTGYDDGTDVTNNAPGDSGDNGNLCHVSSLAWPRLLAAAKKWPLVDLACSGSNLGDVLGSAPGGQYWADESTTGVDWVGAVTKFLNNGSVSTTYQSGWSSSAANYDAAGSAYFGEPTSQLDLVRALHPKVVTLTVGGNDAGFADIIETCIFQQPCASWFANPSGPDKVDERIMSLKPLLADAYNDVKAAAGTSNVYVVTYPSPIAYDSGQSGGSSDCTYMINSDRQWLMAKQPELNNTIIAAAKQAGIHYIDLGSLFAGHDACSGTPYANAPDLPVPISCNTTSCIDNWFHPNKFGFQAMEQAVAAKITF
ncbi:MAG TPA: GDSL-type esterase/lipase family protein, partial [Streptosporangiaceae bacterium]|nr:GDSL-type esterase/lipase family protein [Streptosporangiaceae bacterium]